MSGCFSNENRNWHFFDGRETSTAKPSKSPLSQATRSDDFECPESNMQLVNSPHVGLQIRLFQREFAPVFHARINKAFVIRSSKATQFRIDWHNLTHNGSFVWFQSKSFSSLQNFVVAAKASIPRNIENLL